MHKRVTREQVTKDFEQYAPELEARTTENAVSNRKSETLASLVKRLLNEVSSMKETIGALRKENTAMKAEIRCLRSPQRISTRTTTATAEVNVTKTPDEDIPPLSAAVQEPINGPRIFAMAVRRNLPVANLNDSEKSKLTTLREQVRSYQPKLRTTGIVPLYLRVSRGTIGGLRGSLGTVLPRGSMINLSFVGGNTWRYCARFSTRKKFICTMNKARLPHIKTASPMHDFGEPRDKPSTERR